MGIARRGAAWMPHVGEWAGSSISPTPIKNEERREKRQPGRLFFGYFLLQKIAPAFPAFATSMWLGEAKESFAPSGARTR